MAVIPLKHRCRGRTKQGRRCRRRESGWGWCDAHWEQGMEDLARRTGALMPEEAIEAVLGELIEERRHGFRLVTPEDDQ